MTIAKAQEFLKNSKMELYRKKAEKVRLEKAIEKRESEVKDLKEFILLKEKTTRLLLLLGTRAREESKSVLENMVTTGLQYIFEDSSEFKINYTEREKAGVVEAEFLIVAKYEGREVVSDPTQYESGGYLDVISAILRIALAEMFHIKGPIVLDEPTKHLSEEYVPRFAEFIRRVSTDMNRQIIIISHSRVLGGFGDQTYYFTKKDGITVIEDLTSEDMGEAEVLENEDAEQELLQES